MIPTYVETNRCVRLLVNREKCGWYFDFNTTTSNDVFYQGNCDDGIIELAKLCGYYDELIQIKDAYDKKLKLNAMKNDDNKEELKEDDEPMRDNPYNYIIDEQQKPDVQDVPST
eukprot:743161_1